KYQALLVNRHEEANDKLTIACKLFEYGDIIIKNAKLPSSVQRGDYLAILSTGAYHYSIASNYNQMQKPSVFFIKDGKAREVI
ncbi:UNVERIFIED_CONTAM: diaminopimelate decarboxylase, partial [Escherichia coli]